MRKNEKPFERQIQGRLLTSAQFIGVTAFWDVYQATKRLDREFRSLPSLQQLGWLFFYDLLKRHTTVSGSRPLVV